MFDYDSMEAFKDGYVQGFNYTHEHHSKRRAIPGVAFCSLYAVCSGYHRAYRRGFACGVEDAIKTSDE